MQMVESTLPVGLAIQAVLTAQIPPTALSDVGVPLYCARPEFARPVLARACLTARPVCGAATLDPNALAHAGRRPLFRLMRLLPVDRIGAALHRAALAPNAPRAH